MIPYMSSQQIRQAFVDFYHSKQHKIIPSFPVVAHHDPTTLFVNSGMMPLKGVFLGQNPKGYQRVCNSQKVLRVSGKHNDLDEVGRDDYHHTFFEMLGHWSFGDYFKKDTIRWGWELLTTVYQLPKEHLYVTVHHKDLETRTLWLHETDIDPDHVLNFTTDNFWTMGPTGPCGFCSEVHIDKDFGPPNDQTYRSPTLGVNSDYGRFIEIINFVFMDSTRNNDGTITALNQKNIDTGAGFERLCSIIQNQPSAYETDLFEPIITKLTLLTGAPYKAGPEGAPYRIIADHLRAVSIGLADGVSFDRVGRGYVLRRILRRAQRFGYELGLTSPFMAQLYDSFVATLGEQYPELHTHSKLIKTAITAEETQFAKTLTTGLERLHAEINLCVKQKRTVLSGKVAFHLHDTYGFPMDLTQQIAAEHGLQCDHNEFNQAMTAQKTRAQAAQKFYTDNNEWQDIDGHTLNSVFRGYHTLKLQVNTTRFRRVANSSTRVCYEFIFDQTPFYPTSGGQLGDQGTLTNAQGVFRVTATTKHADGIIHRGELVQSQQKFHNLHDIELIKSFNAEVDPIIRQATARHHSATHLLHSALRETLGPHVTQRGAYCDHQSLRFDFSHPQALSNTELAAIESWVNNVILTGYPVIVTTEDFETAQAQGALYMNTEAYDSQVRVLTMGDPTSDQPYASKELCGGTHVNSTAEIGLFAITAENSIASGTRRITALAGTPAREWYRHRHQELSYIHHLFDKTQSSAVTTDSLSAYPTALKVRELQTQLKQMSRQITQLRALEINSLISTIMQTKITTEYGFDLICHDISDQLSHDPDTAFLEALGHHIAKDHLIAVLWHRSCPTESTPNVYNLQFFTAVSKNLQPQWHAGKLISHLIARWQGKGGGRPDRAQGGARQITLDDHGKNIANQLISVLNNPTPPYSN